MNGMEDAEDVPAVGIELLDVPARVRRLEQRLGNRDVPLSYRVQPVRDMRVLTLCRRYQAEQPIGHPAAGGQDDSETGGRLVFQNPAEAPIRVYDGDVANQLSRVSQLLRCLYRT
jgi:hypothetical protein